MPTNQEKSLNNINTDLECGYKFQNNPKDYWLQYIKHLPKIQYFRRVHIDFEKISNFLTILF